jgi:3-isopropylmalate/(R)-2-methylmalate dehydratase small subunit
MAGWSTHEGTAVSLPLANMDTDQLIPARFMSVPRSEGYGDYLLHDMRRNTDGTFDPAFPLNADNGASVLLVGANFGSGSSREAAVYALVDAGYRAVISPSFGDIFSSNAVNNGLLPARVSEADWDALNQAQSRKAATMIDLSAGTVTINNIQVSFALEESWRVKLINGWDDIDLTQQHTADIAAFSDQRYQTASWAWPAAAD